MKYFSLLLVAFLFSPIWVFGQTVGSTGTGLATYFSNEFHGSTTKYGEVYNRNDLVAAHKTYPYNSRVRVTNLENNQQVTVRIVDQGPFIQGRIIEVSYRAAELLGMLDSKTAKVHVELLSNGDAAALAASNPASRLDSQTPSITPPPPPVPGVVAPSTNTNPPSAAPAVVPSPAPSTAPTPAPVPAERVVTAPVPSPADRAAAVAASPSETTTKKTTVTYEPSKQKLLSNGKFGTGLYKIEIREAGSGTHGVQIASLSSLESAMQEVAKLQAKWFENILVNCVEQDGKMVYKIILGPQANQAEASAYAKQLLKKYKIKGFTVAL